MFESLYAGNYWFARFLIQRALGVIYFIAFINALNQFRPLAGENGLLPIRPFLERVSFKKAPSLFHWHYSDRLLGVVCWIGIVLSLLTISGASEMGPFWISTTAWLLLWALYMSIVNVGQTFYGFGWESMLLEIGFFAAFLGPLHSTVPVLMIWIIRWMLFRVEFGAGLIKMRGDACWRKLTCLNYHHETQPQPNPLSRFFHLLPESLHKIETFFNHAVQLVIIWGLFLPQPVAAFSALLIILSQSYLIISGNYSWLNWMTIVLAFSGFHDAVFTNLFGWMPPTGLQTIPALQWLVYVLTAVVVYLSINPVKNMLSRSQMMNFSFNPLHLVNTYGAFGSVTKKRYEIVVEGTTDETIDDQTVWKEYEFKGKPGDPERIPPVISPYHLRLDWQMWFAAMSSPIRNPWFRTMIRKLLQNDQSTLNLIKHNPFPNEPPKHIRAQLYQYQFTTKKERQETGQWWKRRFVRQYMPAVTHTE